MKQPRPVLILWHPEGDGDPEPVAIVPAAVAQRKLGDYNAASPSHLGTHKIADLDARPLTWDDYHAPIDDYITPALCAYLSDQFGTTWEMENTGGGCTALVTRTTIADTPVLILVTEAEDACLPLLGWARGITVGFYTADTGDMLGDTTDTHGVTDYDLAAPPMTAQQIAEAIADSMAQRATFGL